MEGKNLKEQPKVSIVFITFNGKKYTLDLIDSLKKIKYKNCNIIVVDNGSTDGTQREIKRKYKKSINLIENHKNLGYSEGTNVGIREAIKRGSKYILTMNNDMVVEKNFINYLVEAMEKHPEVAVSTPIIYYMEPKNMIWCAGCDFHLRGFIPRNQNEIDKGQTEGEKYVDGCDCVLMLRSDVLRKVGLLDSELFIIHELTGWCLKASNSGYKCLFVPKSIVWHKVGAYLKNENKNMDYYGLRNWLLIIKKNKGRLYFLGVLFLELTILAAIRFLRYIKNGRLDLIRIYYIAIWHAIINKTQKEFYSP